MNDRERITRLEIRCEQLQLTVNEAFHWIDILKSDLSDLQDKVGYADRKTEPTISKMEQVEDKPKTQMKTQNSNLTFEKRTMRDCYNCKKYETEGECIECHYEPKDECAKEYEELGLKELKELIKADRKTDNSSEKPNNCEHITEDGVTCAKYPACDDCLDNPLNKVKGSKRLLKGKDEPTISKMEQVEDEPQTEPLQTCSVNGRPYTDCCNCEYFKCTADEPQTERKE